MRSGVDGHIKCHAHPRWNQGSTWNMGTINVSNEPKLVSFRGFLTLLNVVSGTSILTVKNRSLHAPEPSTCSSVVKTRGSRTRTQKNYSFIEASRSLRIGESAQVAQ